MGLIAESAYDMVLHVVVFYLLWYVNVCMFVGVCMPDAVIILL